MTRSIARAWKSDFRDSDFRDPEEVETAPAVAPIAAPAQPQSAFVLPVSPLASEREFGSDGATAFPVVNNLLSAAAAGGGRITFSEYSLGTTNPVFIFTDNVVATQGLIRTDGSNPTSPVLAGSSNFQGPINIDFANPVTTISLDAGYFNNLRSTEVLFLDAQGHVLSRQFNNALGIQHFSFTSSVGITGLIVRAVSFDEAGFALDNLAFGPSLDPVDPPEIVHGVRPGGITGSFGEIIEANGGVRTGVLGPSDRTDTFSFSLDTNATVVWQVRLFDDPTDVQTFSRAYAIGNHSVSVVDVDGYNYAQAYELSVQSISVSPFDKEQLIRAKARDIASLILDGTLTAAELATEISLLKMTGAQTRLFLNGVSDALGPLGYIASGIFALVNVANSPNPGRQAFIEIVDLEGALLAALAGAGAGAGIGSLFAGLGAIPGFVIGEILGPFIYTLTISEAVRDKAGEYWDQHYPPSLADAPDEAVGLAAAVAGPVSVIDFDAEWYLQTYAEARAAVSSGASPSAYIYYLSTGILAGHLPHAGAAPIAVGQLALAPSVYLGADDRQAVFEVGLGTLAGDRSSADESRLLNLIQDLRTAPLAIDATLTALANRKALDLSYNFSDDPQIKEAADGPTWAQKWSNGKSFAAGVQDLTGDGSTVTMLAMASTGQSAGEALTEILSSLTNRSTLLSLDYSRIGIAEFGGVWVITLAAGTATAAQVEGAVAGLTRTGGAGADNIALGTWAGTIDGLAGDDTLSGSDRADTLNGGDGDDFLYGRGGADQLNGGAGADTLVAGPLVALADAPPIKKLATTVNASRATAVSLDGSFDAFADANIIDSTFIPHASVQATAHGGAEYYGFTVSTAGSAGTFDIDATSGFDAYIILYDANGQQLAFDDDSSPLDPGGTTTRDPFLTYNFAQAGTYYLLVKAYSGNIAANQTYTLNVSLENAGVLSKTSIPQLAGGPGADVYVIDDALVKIVEMAGGGVDTVRSSVSYVLGGELEALVLTGAGPLNGTGNALANSLTGNDAANLLDGLAGIDVMTGGSGDDIYVVDNTGDQVVELAGGGNDTVRSSVSFTLAANVEALVLAGAGAINGTGNAAANQLTGNDAANQLDGLGGADVMTGGKGNDTYTLDTAADQIIELAGGGSDTVRAGFSFTLAAELENLILIGAGAINGTGNAVANALTGNDAANQLDGGLGVDVMTGGKGDDTYLVDNAGDQVIEASGGGVDTVRSAVTFTLGAEVEKLVLIGAAAINGFGNAAANSLTGNDAGNQMDGGGGADTMAGGKGDDIYIVDSLGDIVVEAAAAGADTVRSAVTYTLGANLEALVLTGAAAINATGNTLANTLTGNTGANQLNGGIGADIMAGGQGDDGYTVDNLGDQVTEGESAGYDTVRSSLSYTLGANLEALLLLGAGVINATGNGLGNSLTGNAAANTLDGGGGADSMAGGKGNDIYIVDVAGDQVIELAGGGVDTVRSAITYALGADVENLVLTGSLGLNGTGNGLANALTGNDAANLLDGGAGNDTMSGGKGDDTYVVDSTLDKVLELSGGGTDTVRSSVSFTLAAEVENLILLGALAINATGNSLANRLTGNDAANLLDGASGADTLTGGKGDDIYVVDQLGDVVVEAVGGGVDTVRSAVTYTLGAQVEYLMLTGLGAINAIGNGVANVLTGNDSANLLDGGAGADTMAGGKGDDVYVVDDIADKVTESAAAGTDTVRSSITYVLAGNLENLQLLGAAAINATGNTLANSLTGNDSANILDGGIGGDTMAGGKGNDTYVVDNLADKVVEAVGGGVDLVRSSVAFTLGAEVENLQLTGAGAIAGTGNALANTLTGNDAANLLNGGAGADALVGGKGNDTYVVDNLGDTVVEAAGGGADLVQSSVTFTLGAEVENLLLTGAGAVNGTGNGLNNQITGNDRVNQLNGGGGVDTLTGGGGRDQLTGGTGADIFVYLALADSTVSASDLIVDFNVGEGDRINLRALDANSTLAGDQAFVFAAAFSGVAGQVTRSYAAATDRTTVRFDVNGDGVADMAVLMVGDHTTSSVGWML